MIVFCTVCALSLLCMGTTIAILLHAYFSDGDKLYSIRYGYVFMYDTIVAAKNPKQAMKKIRRMHPGCNIKSIAEVVRR